MSGPTGRILIADDEESIRFVLVRALEPSGYECLQASSGTEALEILTARKADVAFVDIKMPGLDGLALLSRVKEAEIPVPIIVMTAQNTMANAIEAMKRGAYDYITKPFDVDEVQQLVQRALEMQQMSRDLHRIEREMRRRFELGVEIVGRSAPMQEIYKAIGRVAQTDVTVLIQGESGTGKELIAKAVHYHSPRWSAPFVALNCSAVPRDLLESELFGHERGAFTGALEQRAGKFEAAQGGTLFLDEIGDMPLDLQAKLLRVLQEREFSRIGSHEVIKADCRIIAATNQNLERAIAENKFREDLFFRLNVVAIRVPPLRERREDIPELIRYFVAKANREFGTNVTGLSPSAEQLLLNQPWPGNVRELENALVRSAVLAPAGTLMPEDFPLARGDTPQKYDELSLEQLIRLKLQESLQQAGGEPHDLYDQIIQRVERPLLELVMERANGNQLKAASMLGINRNTLRKKITQLKIDVRRAGRGAGE
jgi:two-component system, NtrC family, nitrogen regulation response regulator GlnG